MKKHRPIKHAHRKALIAEKKARGKYSKPHLPKGHVSPIWYKNKCHAVLCRSGFCPCWANDTKYCRPR